VEAKVRPPKPARVATGGVPVNRLLRETEKTMVRLQKQRDKIAATLSDEAGANDHKRMRELGAELAAAQSALAVAEEEWLTLAEESELGG